MMQFNGQWPKIAYRAAHSGTVEQLITEYAPVLDAPVQIPQSGIASWSLYYFCPHHSVRLIWSKNSPTHHCCPVDGEVFSGEPYDSSWWRVMNGHNASACYHLGLLWQLTGESRYAEKAAEILLGYAKFYPDYEVHGNIPHNGPGKMNAQTLCEANCILDLSLGYDFIADALSTEQQHVICSRLLRCAADFLSEHRSPQIHNHEVKINAALAILGFILKDESLLDLAVNQIYGLRWQLENGLLAEGLWFEGSVHYHFYALQGFFAFEKMAYGSSWSLIEGPWYQKMLNFPLSLLLPDGTFPRLNDCIAGQEQLHHNDLYEFAWHVWQTPLYAAVLNFTDDGKETLEALLWRNVPLPVPGVPLTPVAPLFAPGAGLTMWRRPEKDEVILVKHSPYGGEHDHYDRLSLLIWQNSFPLLPDLGTTGYGARMHYDYYKNSATHNTLTVNQRNQPPVNPDVLNWHQGDRYQWLDCEADWRKASPKINSHTRVEWDAEAWCDIRFRRQLLWIDDVLIDLSTVDNPHCQQLDWTLHLSAEALDQSGLPGVFAATGPLQIMRDTTVLPLQHCQPRHFAHANGTLALWLAGPEGTELWQGYAPNNPATTDLSYLVLRNHQPQAWFACVWDFTSTHPLTEVKVLREPEHTVLTLHYANHAQEVVIYHHPDRLPESKTLSLSSQL